jgi:glycopeptide antibiotics resistance protein
VSDQVVNAVLAVFGGLMLAVVLFVPFAIVSYRRRGRMSFGRTVVWAGSLVYFLALWTFTLLPFPDPGNVKCTTKNLRPFQFIHDIAKFDHSSVLALVHNPALLQYVYNIVLFIPLGFIVRLLWRRGWLFATGLGLGISLFIECTQLTGVWGIYPCSYRVFDVDDLMANTLGALAGGILSLPLARLAASENAPAAPVTVTRGRRLVGMVCDGLSAGLVWAVSVLALQMVRELRGQAYAQPGDRVLSVVAWAAPFAILLVVVLLSGRTPGDLAVGIRFLRADGSFRLVPRVVRYLGGIGGYLALGSIPGLQTVFVVAVLVVFFITKDSRGLAGVLAKARVEVVGGAQTTASSSALASSGNSSTPASLAR